MILLLLEPKHCKENVVQKKQFFNNLSATGYRKHAIATLMADGRR